ncbi:NDP-sugar synthase [Kitasatospora paracochleata]|uniref:NDP-sugar pyrophosphorylase family protein n=1 Tax=Kitasatospora paracochleata TaxID=58354 RepID=A0ABT1J8X8_9ACTN|nr:NDP-sugar synthase [Kitasatospora paracochleata]MCP2313902.1 NDP-sugar pyrophosphorylase family protein [Kitasatospora paracochleata]
MAAIVLAAGRGSRLDPFTRTIPKPLLPVLNVPLILWTALALHRAGIVEFHANVCHLPDAFAAVQRLSEQGGPRLHLVSEPLPSGPLGGVVACRRAVPDAKDYLVVSADALTDLDLAALLATHRRSGADLTLVTTLVEDAHRFGVLDLDADGFVIRMREKPAKAGPLEDISCGIYVMSRQLLHSLTPPDNGRPYDFAELVTTLLACGRRVATHRLDGQWSDIGTPEALLAANLAYLRSPQQRRATGLRALGTNGLWSGQDRTLPPDTRITGPVVLGQDALVEPGTELARVVIGPGSHIGAGCTLVDTVLLPGASVPAGTRAISQIIERPGRT